MVDVLNSSREKVAELTGMVSSYLREKVNGIGILTVETIEQHEWQYITPGTSFFRLRSNDGLLSQTFRIIEVTKSRTRERTSVTVIARHILSDTANELFSNALSCINYTPHELMEQVLTHSTYTVGTVEPMSVIPFVRFEYEPVLSCLLRICSLTGGELFLNEEDNEIDLLTQIGSSNGVTFQYGLNLRGVERTVSLSRIANRVYGVGGGEPPLTLAGATLSEGNDYAENSESITSYGIYESVYHEPTLEDVVNLVDTPALDGTYTNGLCENWTMTGSPAVSKNTDPDYYLYGIGSQRIQSSASGQGIQQTVSVTVGAVYSLSATLFITSGIVRVEVVDGTITYKRPSAVTGAGMVTVFIENWKANNSSGTVKIYQEGTGTGDFYVDSVQIAEGASAKPFTIGKNSDTLWNHATEYLTAHKDPHIMYEVDLVDLYGDIRSKRETERFGLGDTITVIDPTLDLAVSTRVIEREINILKPWRVKVRLDNGSQTIADVLTAMREAYEKGIKHQRALLAESSKAAEVGSTRLGFSSQAFRFFGLITANSWNSLSWSSGTLRVGNAYFTVLSGSASSLYGSSIYYFYFDRTAPSMFSYTTTSNNAEGEDKILIFAVTTTSSPTLLEVHPLGIIHL